MHFLIILFIIILLVIYLVWFRNNNSFSQLPFTNIDLNRYQGRWYEIARLPVYFQNGCVNTTANYTLNADNTITVVNTCILNNGSVIEARGIGRQKFDASGNIYPGRLDIYFENSPFAGEYNIIFVDRNYQFALVGTQDRTNLWILSRNRSMDNRVLQDLIFRAKNLGFDTRKLIISNS